MVLSTRSLVRVSKYDTANAVLQNVPQKFQQRNVIFVGKYYLYLDEKSDSCPFRIVCSKMVAQAIMPLIANQFFNDS